MWYDQVLALFYAPLWKLPKQELFYLNVLSINPSYTHAQREEGSNEFCDNSTT